MDEHLNIVQQMANGANPFTGEIFDDTHICQNVNVARALISAAVALENETKRQQKKRHLPANAGKPWDDEEDARLLNEFDDEKSIKELSDIFERTTGSIQSRLVKHGRLTL